MKSPLRILYLEDDVNDASLVQATLEAEGVVCDVKRVETEADFSSSLEQGSFDLILADYTLPEYDGISALKITRQNWPDVPFIFVSGTLGEEVAIEALKIGATDYVFKTRLSRIAPSVRRAVLEAKERTERRRVEQALQRNQAYLAEAQRISHTGSFGWDVSSGEIYWSEETFRIFEFEPTSKVTIERVVDRTHPEDRSAVQKLIERVTRKPMEFDLEHRLLMPDGSVKHLQVMGRPSTDESGRFEFVGAVTDITERKRAEEELQQLVDFVPQIIVVLGPDGKGMHVNRVAREYTGLTLEDYRSADMIGRVIHPDDVEKMRAVRECGLSAADPFEIEARLLGKDGVYRWFLFRYNPLVQQGSVRWYATATEIESRKQEEERVRKENVRLEERTRIARELHDTLLQSFLSASMQLSVALDGVPSDLPVKPRLDRILQLMNQGIEDGRNTLRGLRSSDSRTLDLVMALSGIQQELAVHPDIDFRVVVGGRQQPLRPPIRHEIYRIGREALLNAFCHSRAKRVEFELEYADSDLRMRVRDNGCGIDPQVLQAGREGHWGLAGMRERATKIGGQLKISSLATIGTEVQLSIPSGIAFQLSPCDQGL